MIAERCPQPVDMNWVFTNDIVPPDDCVLGHYPIRVGRCDPFLLDQVMLLDVSDLGPSLCFEAKSHPTIQHYTYTKSNWSSLAKGSLKMKTFEPHIRATNEPNRTGTRLPFKEGPDTTLLLRAIDYVPRTHANKPPNPTRHSVNIYDANIPTSFI